jgi:hypothetical protein
MKALSAVRYSLHALLCLFMLIFAYGTTAQVASGDVVYLSPVLETTTRKKAAFYRTHAGMHGDLHVGRTYDMDGKLKAEGRYADQELSIEHGQFVFYHANGEVESRGAYVMGNKTGVWERYDQWGRPLAEKIYDPEVLANIVHTRAQTMPRYREGDEKELVRYIKQHVTSPDGRRMKGAYTASFIVEKDGELSDIKVIQTKGPQVEEQVVDAIRRTAPWEPGAERGQPVRVQVRLPVQF